MKFILRHSKFLVQYSAVQKKSLKANNCLEHVQSLCKARVMVALRRRGKEIPADGPSYEHIWSHNLSGYGRKEVFLSAKYHG